MECSVTLSIMGQLLQRRIKHSLEKYWITKSQWDVVWIYFEHKFFPLILNDNENSSLYCKQSQQHSQKPKKLCFQLENKEKSMGPTFSEVVNRGRCFSSCHERGTKEKKSESRAWQDDTGSRHRKKKSESSWGIEPHGDSEFFSLSHARDKTKKHPPLFLYRAQNLLSSAYYIYEVINVYKWCN